jgi:hypothetical protein
MARSQIPLALCLLALASCHRQSGSGDDFWDQDGGTDLDTDSDTDTDTDADSDTDTGTELEPAFADTVVEAPGHTGEGFGDSLNAANGVLGCGLDCSSEDVFSLGYDEGVDNYVTLRWEGRIVKNGEGADFAVFENPFLIGGGPSCFMDHAVVSISRDGEEWIALPHDYTNDDEAAYVADPELWVGFAGVRPVLLNEDSNPVAPYDPEAAGGDHFDLDDLPDGDPEAEAIKAEGFTFVKIVTAPTATNPDTGEPFVHEDISNGADIDGVYAWYFD